MEIQGHPIGVCSWSLQPRDMQDLVARVRQLGLRHMQLGMLELVQLDDKRKHQELGHLSKSGIVLKGGMMSFPGEDYSTISDIRRTGGFVPDDEWPVRQRLAQEFARLARELGVATVSTHVGFVPDRNAAGYETIRGRVRQVAEMFAGANVELLMETGQERAEELMEFLEDLAMPNVHINFDPANMILYGAGDPMEAIRILGGRIHHVHAKDGRASTHPGEQWGEEVALGKGQVNPRAFLAALKAAGFNGPISIEREAGNDRMGDVRFAIQSLKAAAQ